MGRPIIGEAKTERLEIRMSKSEYENLAQLSKKLKKSKTDIIKEALDLYQKILEVNINNV